MPLLWRYCLDDHVWLPEGRMPLNSNHQNRDRYANLEEDSDCDSNDSSRKWFEGRDLRSTYNNNTGPYNNDNTGPLSGKRSRDKTALVTANLSRLITDIGDLSTFEDREKIAALTYSLLFTEPQVLDGSQVADGGRPIRYGGQLRIRGNPNKQSRTEAATLRGSGEGDSWRARGRYPDKEPGPGQGLEAVVKATVIGEEDSTQTPGPPGWGLDVGPTTHSGKNKCYETFKWSLGNWTGTEGKDQATYKGFETGYMEHQNTSGAWWV
ncbi:hypothetical protein J6590_083805 [Homalodisca vitripennis]|nr:hypothetical protein J6590_083805 [Homalodisca vitripennis]